MSKQIFFLILILTIKIAFSNYIHLNFVKDINKNPYDIENFFFSSISTNITIGTPPKNITVQISTDSPYLVLKGDSLKEKNYIQEKSSSFYFIKYGHSYSYKNIYFHSIFFDENFNFDENKQMKLNSMMCWGRTPISKTDGIIGLQLKDIKFNEKNIFLNQLYEKKIIKNKIFSILYNKENTGGELIIGDYPMNNTNLLKNKKIKICENNFKTEGTVYGTIFSQINLTIPSPFFREKNNLMIFSNAYYGLIGSHDYQYYIYETFFKEKIKLKNCWIQTIDDDKYFGYVCSKNTDMSIISNIYFYHKELNYTFEIKNEEMWIAKNNIKYFLIFFSYSDQYSWTLGEIFMKKYNMIFDGNKNLIGLYYSEEENDNNKINYCKIFIGILILLLIIACLIIGCFYIHKIRNKNRKKDKNINNKDKEIELNLVEDNNDNINTNK